jgi:hypothetical protein
LLLEMRLEHVFCVRLIVMSLTRSTMFNSTIAGSSNVSVERLRPCAARTGERDPLGLSGAVEIRLRAEIEERLRVRTASRPSSSSR